MKYTVCPKCKCWSAEYDFDFVKEGDNCPFCGCETERGYLNNHCEIVLEEDLTEDDDEYYELRGE